MDHRLPCHGRPGYFLNGRALGNTRAAQHPLTRTPFASSIGQRLPHADRPSGRRATGPGSDPCRPHFGVLTTRCLHFPMLRQWEKMHFFPARATHLPGPASTRNDHGAPVRSVTSAPCKFQAPTPSRLAPAREQMHPLHSVMGPGRVGPGREYSDFPINLKRTRSFAALTRS